MAKSWQASSTKASELVGVDIVSVWRDFRESGTSKVSKSKCEPQLYGHGGVPLEEGMVWLINNT